ncbi:DNA-binding response regulator, partial [Mycobacterium tuberculosis]|nr:DNA-binding response regulator [Mycobacterium tuberculosis]
ADDYIAKPVELRELVARIRSVLRRVVAPPAPAAAAAPDDRRITKLGDYRLDMESRVLTSSAGEEQVLMTSEFNLLK